MKTLNSLNKFICLWIFIMGILTCNAQKPNINLDNFPETITLNDGNTIKLKELRGKIVILDFWHRGCYPCLLAIPDLVSLQNEFKNELVVIGINDIDYPEDVTDYYNYKKVNFKSTYKTKVNIAKLLNITVYPTTIIINPNGKVESVELGYGKKSSHRRLKSMINKMLADKNYKR